MDQSTQERIVSKLDARFDLQHLEVENESGGHNVPTGSETHFRVVLVSDEFDNVGLLGRHRAVNEVLSQELEHGVHALALHTYTRDEWQKRFGDAPLSPPCLGGQRSPAESG